jgi:protein-S-isoprenylcysteine O-methyltransferase Ste14
MNRVIRFLVLTTAVSAALFGLAGTWRDPWIWAYIGVFTAVGVIAMLSITDELARERYNPPSRGADPGPLHAIRLVAIAHLVVGVLDGARFHWSNVPTSVRAIGLVGFAVGFLVVVRAMAANRFFSSVVRVQAERGHRVVDHGPYGIVRHPGYAGMIPAVPFSALALGSWPALALALVYSGLIVRRVQFEDRFLRANLAGYGAYAHRVRYRLVPSVW